MLEVIKDNTEKDIIVVLDVFNDIYSGLTKASPFKVTKIRQYAYATAVTRLYAIFEHFIEKNAFIIFGLFIGKQNLCGFISWSKEGV
ncbi:hypothetical protein [Klebsiella variicola]|uniref:hypothetical protein n=1 Tax=Klebsiella variicola TaxID=244366 RepID=UPI0015E9CF2A|nr:hypothetical protein [Klebsiella variicola]QLS57785.1 hypothetical protein HV312_12775 [Klebsiella variicola]